MKDKCFVVEFQNGNCILEEDGSGCRVECFLVILIIGSFKEDIYLMSGIIDFY